MYFLPSFCTAFSPQYDVGGPNQYPGTSNLATYDFPIVSRNFQEIVSLSQRVVHGCLLALHFIVAQFSFPETHLVLLSQEFLQSPQVRHMSVQWLNTPFYI